ncbi:MAG: UDP-glucose 4-epimerase [Patescibacteria group bacterium]
MKKILVTGGAGYIGSITSKKLLDSGFEVIVLDNFSTGHKEAVDKRAVLEVADLKDKNRIITILREHQIEAVVDFAASIAVGESQKKPKEYLENNVFNFLNLLDALSETGIKMIIKSSTAAVYGTPPDPKFLPLSEDYVDIVKYRKPQLEDGFWGGQKISGTELFDIAIDCYHKRITTRPELMLTAAEIDKLKIPGSIYGFTKLLDEIVMKKYDDMFGIKGIVLRYFNAAGADQSGEFGLDNPNPTHLIGNAIFQLLGKRKKLTIFGNDYPTKDGTCVRDYIHVNDLAIGHIKALQYLDQNHKSETFNLGTGSGYSVLEVIESIEKASGKKVEIYFGNRRPGDVVVVFANPAKAKDILGWNATHGLDDMTKDAWRWHSTHPDGYNQAES